MQAERKRFVIAIAALIGSTIGVGIFGMPYAFSRIGLVPAIAYVVVLGGIQLMQQLFYAEAAIACPEPLRLVGLTGKYLGKKASIAATVSTVLSYWGGLIAYIIVGGTFLHALVSPFLGGQVFTYQVIGFVVAASVVWFGLDVVSRISFFATVGLISAMVAIFVLGVPHVRPDNLPLVTGLDWFLPYGVVLFSLSGLPAILEMEDILKGDHKYYRLAVVIGTVTAAVLTTAFGIIVWGVTGAATTNDAVTGLRVMLGPGIATIGAVFGTFSVSASFLAVATNLRSTFRYDYKFSKLTSWLLTLGPPFAVFLLGAKDFVGIIGFSGAVFGGITAALVALLYIAVTHREAVKERRLGAPIWLAYASIAVLSAGALYEAGTTAVSIIEKWR
ncbi:MAG TPA: aromatic amino acid transport family protein [Candidatus Eisenbacteria bacterium]|jgi:amino acid permease|nr:aromatic amino acid transport family protein [Candidatus Eisenbacteria bacterium]